VKKLKGTSLTGEWMDIFTGTSPNLLASTIETYPGSPEHMKQTTPVKHEVMEQTTLVFIRGHETNYLGVNRRI